jgi:hypothetical protein
VQELVLDSCLKHRNLVIAQHRLEKSCKLRLVLQCTARVATI